jgi:hypothetical protein
MIYHIQASTEKTRYTTDAHGCCKIPYITIKEMKRRHPDESFVIIGEIGNAERAPTEGAKLCTEDGKMMPILPRGSFRWPFERVIGYVRVENNSYVAVIGGFFRLFVSIGCFLKSIAGIR